MRQIPESPAGARPARSGSLLISAIVALLVLAPSQAGAAALTDPLGGAGGGPIAGSLHVRVVEAEVGTPIPGAYVLVGPRPGQPFASNWGFTSGSGDITFSNPALIGSMTVTAGASGHAYFTILEVNANDLVLALRESAAPVTYRVGNYVSGIDVNNGSFHFGDGYFDMAVVLPALRLSNLFSFDLASIMGPLETINIMGQDYPIPANIFVPDQWELLNEIIKDHYYLYLPAGPTTLVAMSGRVPLDALVNSTSIYDVLPVTSWREIDKLDITISGDTNDADLFVDPDLTPTVTLNVSNIPENSVATCFSMADLDAAGGMGRLIPLGLSSIPCPAGSGGCAGSVSLSTTPAVGEFSGMTYFPAVAVQDTTGNDAVVLVDRASHAQSYTEDMSTFFRFLDLSAADGVYSWSDAANPAAGSPPVDVNAGHFIDSATDQVFWEYIAPGNVRSFPTPGLGQGAPFFPLIGTDCHWDQTSVALTWQLPSFNFNQFAFSDLLAHGSHLASDRLESTWMGEPPVGSAEDASRPASLDVSAAPNPSSGSLVLRFALSQARPVDLSIFSASGRRIARLRNGTLGAGVHQVTWDGRGTDGAMVPNGVYLARLQSGPDRGYARIVVRR